MNRKRCKSCFYHGFVGSSVCCDYILITGESRTKGKKMREPCQFYRQAKKPRQISRLVLGGG